MSGHSGRTFHVAYDYNKEIDDSLAIYDNTKQNNKHPDYEYAHHQNVTHSNIVCGTD